MSGARDGMSDVERPIELHTIFRLKGRRGRAVDQTDPDIYAELHADDNVAMSIGTDLIRWRFSFRELVRTHAALPEAAVLAAGFSGENILVGVG